MLFRSNSQDFVANTPDLYVRFLQNYKIDVSYKEKATGQTGTLTIDTRLGRDNPDFQYRIGNLFMRENSIAHAARIGRFSSHTHGTIDDHDLSWISYPDVDPKFFHKESLKYKKFFTDAYLIENVTVTVENSAKLLPNRGFHTINNLEMNFYWFNHEKDDYELLNTAKVEKHFNAGVNETFEVVLNNVPPRLVEENYFKHGEFIISETSDYDIPDLETTWQKMLGNLKGKSIPVVFNTPLESKIYRVSVDDRGLMFAEILERIFGKNYKIEGDVLVKIGQFENNLPALTYLKEVKDKDKLGKWFILTNEINLPYLDYRFKETDRISISYVTGSELARQSMEKITSFMRNVDGGDNQRIIPLGNVTPNSKIEVQIKPERRYGENLDSFPLVIDEPMRSMGNNQVFPGLYCKWEMHIPKKYDEALVFNKGLAGELVGLTLRVNDKEFSLAKLSEDGVILVTWESDESDASNLHLEIDDPAKLGITDNSAEYLLALKITSEKMDDFVGVKLLAVDRGWHLPGGCIYQTPIHSLNLGVPVSNESIHLEEILYVRDNYIKPELRGKVTVEGRRTFFKKFSVTVSSTINNFYN